MSQPFIGQIKIFSFNFAPRGWALCNGQTLPIAQNQALFSLLGTTYGGNGTTNFLLPNLQGRVPMHVGNGLTLGQAAGNETVTLLTTQMPAHTHSVSASNAAPTLGPPTNNLWAQGAYSASTNGTMLPADISNNGSGQGHENRSPFTVLSFCIALTGIFPSRN